MRPQYRFGAIALLLVFVSAVAVAAEPPAIDGRASLPLKEVLRLNRAVEENARPVDKPPPVAGTLDRAQFEGRLLDDALDLTGHFDVTVLAGDDWVEVPLLRLTTATHVTRLPDLADASFVVKHGQLALVTKRAQRYSFEVGIVQDAGADGDAHLAQLQVPASTLATMRVAFDQALFELLTDGVVSDAAGVLLYPTEGGFAVRWRRRAVVEERPVRAIEARRPLVTVAHASVVSTLGAPRITRVLYELQLTGEQIFTATMPPGHALEEVYLNGVRAPFERNGNNVELGVHPARSGDEGATLELMITSPRDNYLLSGRVDFEVPAVSWGVNELYVDLHLPSAFSYDWAGGSLAPGEASSNIHYANEIPSPGKKLSLHQVLIDETVPSVRVAYAIDLTGHYFSR